MKVEKVRREFGVRGSQLLPCLTVFNLTGPLQFFISVCMSYRGNPEIDRFSTSSSSSPSFNFPLLQTTISSFTYPMQANSPFSAPPRSGTFKSPRASLLTEHSFTLEVQWLFFAAGLDIANTSRSDAKTVGLAHWGKKEVRAAALRTKSTYIRAKRSKLSSSPTETLAPLTEPSHRAHPCWQIKPFLSAGRSLLYCVNIVFIFPSTLILFECCHVTNAAPTQSPVHFFLNPWKLTSKGSSTCPPGKNDSVFFNLPVQAVSLPACAAVLEPLSKVLRYRGVR